MAVIVAVVVIGPVIVAALVNGNDTVGVIDAVSEHATCSGDRAKHGRQRLGEACVALIENALYEHTAASLERVVAMLTKLVHS